MDTFGRVTVKRVICNVNCFFRGLILGNDGSRQTELTAYF